MSQFQLIIEKLSELILREPKTSDQFFFEQLDEFVQKTIP
jgi:hypothetical protein